MIILTVLAGLFCQYQPISIEEFLGLQINKIEQYSEITTHVWVKNENQDTVVTGVAVYRYEFDSKMLSELKVVYHPVKNQVCSYGCKLNAGLLVINGKYLINVPCGYQDNQEIVLLFFPNNEKCSEYRIKGDINKYVKRKEKLIPTESMIPEYREMLKVNLKIN